MNEWIGTIFLFIALGLLVYILALLFSHLYQIFEEPTIQKRMRKLRKPMQPWVTVLLYSQGSKDGIDVSLKALLKNYYHNFDIVVVKDYSRNAKRALEKGYKSSQKGAVVISLQSGVIVPRSFIKRAIVTRGERRKYILRMNSSVSINSLSNILHALDGLSWQSSLRVHISDANNMLVPKSPQTYSILSILTFGAIAAASIAVNDWIVLWYSWLIVTSYLFAIIWLREEKVKVKLQLSFSAFSALFLLPVASFVTRLSQFRTRN